MLSYEDARAKQVFEEDITESARATFSWPTTAVGQLAENLLGKLKIPSKKFAPVSFSS